MKNLFTFLLGMIFLTGVAFGQTITITSPNGGENLDGCTSHTIAWTATGTSNSFSIDYSIDNGVNWTSVASFYFTTLGTFSWQVPNVSSTNCLVRVYDSNAPAVTDSSNAVFSINGPLILQTPNGGENWVAGTVQNISWFASGTSNIYQLEYTTNNGANWVTIANNLNNTTGTYNWTVPNVNTSLASIRITDINNAPCMSDKSDLVFNIVSTVQVTNPNGGENFAAIVGPNGGSYNMNSTEVVSNTGNFYDNGGRTGNYSAYQNVTKTFYPDNPNLKLAFAFSDFSLGSGDYFYVYDGPSTSSPLLGSYTGSNMPPTLTSTHKTGALTFRFTSNSSGNGSGWRSYYTTVGAGTQPLNWSITGTSGEFDIEFSSNGGASWTTVIADYPSTTGTFDWPVPNVPTTAARVRIVDSGNNDILDPSDANFTITGASPSMLLCTPNGGEARYAGTNYNITWRTGFTSNPNVHLELSTDNGATWATIIASTLNDGSYTWMVPNSASTNCLVRVSEVGNATAFDVSDAVFTILPHYRLTQPNGGESLLGCDTPYSISWFQGGTSNRVDIDLSTDGGTSWISIENDLARSGTSINYNWVINNVTSTNCLMRVRDHNDTTKFDISDAPFTINATSNTVVNQPNGGEFWVAGGTFPIVYVVGGTVTNVRLEYSTNNGTSWNTIVNNTSGGSYNWTIPNINTNQALIRATDVSNDCNTDISDAVFNILSEVQVTVPNGGETYMASGGPNGTTYLMNNTADVTMTTGNFYDNGGRNGNYSAYQNVTRTFRPFNPTAKLQFTFTEFQTASSPDYLQIYDGPSTSSPLIGTFSGNNNPGTITSTDKAGALTFRFISNSSSQSSGWKAHVTSYQATNPTIAWNVTGTSQEFDLDYSTDGGVTWVMIADDIEATTTGGFSWPVPNTVTSNGRVRVVDANNNNIVDQSNAAFSITPATPVYLQCYPNGGERLYAGNTANLQWATAFSTSPYVRIELSTDNGATWTTAIASTFNDGTEPWLITNTPSANCRMRVTDTQNAANTDISDTTFTIRPYITVVSPNGAETLTGCTSHVIRWENGGTSNEFDLEYSLDGGTTWSSIVSGYTTSSTNATYNWSVPNLASTNARIRITDSNAPAKTDMSDAAFTFQPSQNVQVINPNGGQNMVAGTVYPILYTVQGGVTNVRIEYSADSGATWSNIISSTNGGTYNWTVPNVSTTQALVRVTSTSNSCNFDVSNAVFNIISEITLTSPNGGQSIVATGGINGGTYLLNNSTDAVVTTGNFYDAGGRNGSYPNYQNTTKTFYPLNPNAKLQTVFHQFATASSPDYLRIYDGPSTSSPLIGSYYSNQNPGTVTSTHKTGALTFRFVSNQSSQNSGWRATMTSVHPGNPTIAWNNTGTSEVYNIEVSSNNGTSWTRIVTEFETSTNTFSWPAPNTPSTQALVRVIDANNGDIMDVSNSTFTINSGVPAYLVCYPNGGETVSAGDVRNVTWRSGLTVNPNVKIELTTDNGANWSAITNSTFDNGTFAWTVPNVPSTICRVRVSDATNPTYADMSDSTFTIRPYVTVISPNGGENLTGCTSHSISWQNGGTSNEFDLSYSLDSGATWTSIVTNLSRTQSIPTYTWPVPNVISSQCLISITDSNDPLKTDTSNAVFTISPTLNVQVGQPNGGENLVTGNIYPINFTKQGGVTNVRIEYSVDSGATWTTLISNTTAGSYNWTVPNTPSTTALVRITDIYNSCNSDVSDAIFNIVSSIVVTSPNGGESIDASGGTNGGTFNMVTNDIVASTGNFYDNGGPNSVYSNYQNVTKTFYPFNPNAKLRFDFHEFRTYSGSDYLRVYDGPSTSSQLLGTFSGTSVPGPFTSTHKTGALTFVFISNQSSQREGWKATFTSIHPDNHTIAWSTTGTSGEYDLELSTNGGLGWTRIVSEYTSSTNTFPWPAPNTPTTNALIRVLDHNNNADVVDISDAPFTINGTDPAYLVCYPNGGETIFAGRTANITWRSGFTTTPYVHLEYSTNGGTSWNTIATNVFDNGSYAWTIPNTPSTNCLLRVSDNSNPAHFDVSDSVFTIRPYITVIAPNGGENLTGCVVTTLRWENGGTSNSFDLDYSTNGGTTWTSIITGYNTSAQNATFNWAAPNVISNQCLVRVTDANDPTKSDTSDAVFSINPSANVRVVTPNGGEIWVAGAIYPINYALQGGVTSVKIDYSPDGGTTWVAVTTNTSGGSYNWTIPNFASANALVRVTDRTNPCNFDISDAIFTVLSEIDLQSPNGGDTVKASVVQNGNDYRLNTSTTAFVGVANFYDAGGPTGNYPNYANYTRTFNPENPTHKLRISWHEFSVSSGDYLRVYDGPTTSSTLIGTYTGSTLPPVITSTHKTGALTFRFTSGSSGNSSGFKAYLVSTGVENVPVSWNTIGTSEEFDLQYSTNDGLTWIDILDEYVSSTGVFNWPVPNTPSNTARFRVQDHNNGDILDDSDTTFVIQAGTPVVAVCSPNGGESYSAGNTAVITWGSIYLSAGSVRIEYSTDAGTSWNIITNAVANNGSYNWTVPNAPSTNCLVRITDFGNAANTDVSDSVFTIRPHITVVDPNGGETVTGCNVYPIQWLHGGTSGAFRLEYSTTGGGAWTQIANVNASGNSGSFNWLAPNINAANSLIRITDINDGSKIDSSDAAFAIQQTFDVTVNSPNGAENWVAGTQQNIVYTLLNGVTNVRLEYSTDGGTSWSTIISNTSGGSYTWTIPNLPTTNALIRARDVSNSCKADVSDAVFNIVSNVQVATPNGGEVWQGQVGTPGGIFNMSNTPVTCNSGNFFDNGGENSNYSNYSNFTKTFTPDISSNKIQVTFTAFATSNSSDYLRIYDGPTTSSPLIGSFSGNNNPGTVTSTHPTGALTFRFVSNSSGNASGWESYVSTVGTPRQNITWSANGTSGGYNIDYSTNAGLTWTNIVQEFPGVNGGIYPWQIPNTPSTTCLVRVTDDNNGNIVDVSDANFTIGAATPHMYTPNGGESVFSGVSYDIKWDAPTYLSTNVQIEYSTDGGQSWSLIEAFTFNDGTYSWIPPQTAVSLSNCYIRVSESGNTIAFDVSDQPFTINPAVRITSPNSNTGNFRGCTQSTISWIAGASSNYRIELSVDSGANWSTVEANYINNNSVVNYPWSIPNNPSTNCLVRVTDNNNPTRTDVSDSVFTITPTITITQPNFTGQQIQGGTNFTLTWNSNVVSNFYDIDYTTNGGTTWNNIATNYFTTTDDYVWAVPATVQPSAFVRVRDNLNTCKEDISDYPFAITAAAPAITITAPNGGENLSGCSSYAITWTELTTSGFFNIDYSADGGATWNVVASNYNTASGSYLWTVPNINSSQCVVRVTDAANPQKTDVSNQAFNIAQSLAATITASGSTAICSGDTVYLTSSSAAGNLWAPFGETTQTIAATSSGNYSVTVNQGGCTATSQPVAVTVSAAPTTPTITTSGSTTLCAGDNVILTSSSPSGNTWSNSATTQAISVNTAGTYTVTTTNQFGCSATSSPVTVTVNPLPATPSATSNSPVITGGTINLMSSTITGATYSWTGPNSFTSGTQNPSLNNATAAMTGTYSVTATVNGCTSAAGTVSVNVVPPGGIATIAGTVLSEMGDSVRTVSMTKTGFGGPSTQVTGLNGAYEFNLTANQNYTLTPRKANDSTTNNGLTTLDIILMRRHILNDDTLSTPYKILAGDVNFSNAITTLDIVLTRRVILQTTPTFPGGRLWTFVNSDFVFANPMNPWPYEDFRTYPSAASAAGQDFVGVKLGDVNNSWSPSIAKQGYVGNLGMDLSDVSGEIGEIISIPVRVRDFEDIAGYQFTLEWDAMNLEYMGAENGVLNGHFGENEVSLGKLTTSWDDEMGGAITLEDGAEVFTLKFLVKGQMGTESMVYISSALTDAEGYNAELELLSLNTRPAKVSFGGAEAQSGAGAYALGQNVPNPFDVQTEIAFKVPETSQVQFTIFGLDGRTLKTMRGVYEAGTYKLTWDGRTQQGDKVVSGVYYIRMTAGDFTATRKMVFMHR